MTSKKIFLDIDKLFVTMKRFFSHGDQKYCAYSRYARIYSEDGFLRIRMIRVTGDFVELPIEVDVSHPIDCAFDLRSFMKIAFGKTINEPKKYKMFFSRRTLTGIRKERTAGKEDKKEDKNKDNPFKGSMIALQEISGVLFVFLDKGKAKPVKPYTCSDEVFRNNPVLHDFLFKEPDFSFDKKRIIIASVPSLSSSRMKNLFYRETKLCSPLQVKSNLVLKDNDSIYTRIFSWNMFFVKTSSGAKVMRFGYNGFYIFDLGKEAVEKGEKPPVVYRQKAVSMYCLKDIGSIIHAASKNESRKIDIYETEYGSLVDIEGCGRCFSISKLSRNDDLQNARDEVDGFYMKAMKNIVPTEEGRITSFSMQMFDFFSVVKLQMAFATGVRDYKNMLKGVNGKMRVYSSSDMNRFSFEFEISKNMLKRKRIETFSRNGSGVLELDKIFETNLSLSRRTMARLKKDPDLEGNLQKSIEYGHISEFVVNGHKMLDVLAKQFGALAISISEFCIDENSRPVFKPEIFGLKDSYFEIMKKTFGKNINVVHFKKEVDCKKLYLMFFEFENVRVYFGSDFNIGKLGF